MKLWKTMKILQTGISMTLIQPVDFIISYNFRLSLILWRWGTDSLFWGRSRLNLANYNNQITFATVVLIHIIKKNLALTRYILLLAKKNRVTAHLYGIGACRSRGKIAHGFVTLHVLRNKHLSIKLRILSGTNILNKVNWPFFDATHTPNLIFTTMRCGVRYSSTIHYIFCFLEFPLCQMLYLNIRSFLSWNWLTLWNIIRSMVDTFYSSCHRSAASSLLWKPPDLSSWITFFVGNSNFILVYSCIWVLLFPLLYTMDFLSLNLWHFEVTRYLFEFDSHIFQL